MHNTNKTAGETAIPQQFTFKTAWISNTSNMTDEQFGKLVRGIGSFVADDMDIVDLYEMLGVDDVVATAFNFITDEMAEKGLYQ